MVCRYRFPTAVSRPRLISFPGRTSILQTRAQFWTSYAGILYHPVFVYFHSLFIAFTLTILFSLLAPIGQYRNLYTQPSRGKRFRKRKPTDTATPVIPPPSPPSLNLFITIGLNSTNRHLESMTVLPAEKTPSKPRLLAVFVCRSDSQPSQLHSHLPVLCNIASQSSPEHTVRLVQLPKGAEARLTTSLAIPQVGFLGLMEGAPGSTSLLHFLEEKVPAIEVPWLSGSLGYQPTVIRAMKTIAPPTKKTVVRVDTTDKTG